MPITCTSAQCSLLRLGGRIYYILRCRRCAHADAQALDLFATEEYEICRLKSQRRFVPFTAPYGASEGQGSEAKAEREGLELHVGAFEHVHGTISHVEGYHRDCVEAGNWMMKRVKWSVGSVIRLKVQW